MDGCSLGVDSRSAARLRRGLRVGVRPAEEGRASAPAHRLLTNKDTPSGVADTPHRMTMAHPSESTSGMSPAGRDGGCLPRDTALGVAAPHLREIHIVGGRSSRDSDHQ